MSQENGRWACRRLQKMRFLAGFIPDLMPIRPSDRRQRLIARRPSSLNPQTRSDSRPDQLRGIRWQSGQFWQR